MKHAGFVIKSITPIPYEYDVQLKLAKDAESDIERDQVPVLAWAVVESRADGTNSIEPVFLDSFGIPVVFSGWQEENRKGHGIVSYEIVPRQ